MRSAIWFGVLALTLTAPASAQWRGSPMRVTAGIGYGRANVSCDNCRAGQGQGGVAGFVELEARLGRALRLGVGIDR